MRTKTKYVTETASGYAVDRFVTYDRHRVHVYKDGYPTVTEAKADLERQTQLAIDRYCSKHLNVKSVRQAADDYLNDLSNKVAVQTYYGIEHILMRHFLSHLEMKEAASRAFSPSRMRGWYGRLISDGSLNEVRKNVILSKVRAFMSFCWRKEKIIEADEYTDLMGLLENVRVPKAPKKEKEVWDEGQIARFFAAIDPASDDYAMFQLFFYLGARLGEFLALTWDDFDRFSRTIRIEKQIIKDGYGGRVSGDLKTAASYRECYLTDDIYQLLLGYESRFPHAEGRDFIFSAEPTHKRNMSFHAFRRRYVFYERLAGLPHTTPHSARHGKATELAKLCRNEEEVKAVASFLGHSPAMMMNTYVHVNSQSTKNILMRKSHCAVFPQNDVKN